MNRLVAISRVLDWPSRVLGQTLPWLVAAVVLLKFSTVGLRYAVHAHGGLFLSL
jgi:TRAP-type mannitol/chloroaromatic compound transport system permease small subunit